MNTDNTSSVTTFSSFDLPKPLTDALETMRYREPTPIQSKGIPVVMEGKDLIGIAQTGTGKTAAFGIPMVKSLFLDKEAQGLILVPTRELATQTYEVIRQLTQNMRNLKAWVLVGGTSMYAQVKSLPRHPRLIIATPGRLQDHLDKRTFNLNNLKIAVLDEADRMLDIGFEPQIRKIFEHLPKERQTLLFSATFAREIERLTRDYMSHPAKITIGKVSEPAKAIEQSFIHTTVQQKNPLLIEELQKRTGSVLVFVRTKHKVDRITRLIDDAGFEVDRIHGARTQGQRNRVMQDFRNMKIRILVATDVASRGLDITHIEHVINYDIPEVPEDYVHRIGRTARAGAKGESVSFITPEDKEKWMYLSRHLNAMGVKTAFTQVKVPAMAVKPATVSETKKQEAASKEPAIEYKKERNYARKTSRYNRSQSHFSRQRTERSDRAPRSEGRSFDSRGPRGEGRSFQKREGGERSFNRSDRGPRSEGRSFNRSFDSRGPRGEGRSFQKREGGERSFNRFDRAPRGEGRSFDSRGPRGEGRSFQKREGGERSFNRFDRSDRAPKKSYAPKGGPRPSRPQPPREDRNFDRSDRRPRHADGRPYGGSNSKPSAPRSEGRSFDSRGPRGEGRSFQKREGGERSFNRSDRRPSGGRSFSRPGRPGGRPQGGRPSFNRDR